MGPAIYNDISLKEVGAGNPPTSATQYQLVAWECPHALHGVPYPREM